MAQRIVGIISDVIGEVLQTFSLPAVRPSGDQSAFAMCRNIAGAEA